MSNVAPSPLGYMTLTLITGFSLPLVDGGTQLRQLGCGDWRHSGRRRGHAGVDGERRSGHVLALIPGEVDDRAGDRLGLDPGPREDARRLGWKPRPIARPSRASVVHVEHVLVVEHRRRDVARAQRVDP